MTTTSTGTNGFPVRYIAIAAAVVAALVVMTFAVSQQGTDSRQTVSVPQQASAASSDALPDSSGLSEALASGKFDIDQVPSSSPSPAPSNPSPESIVVTGQGSSYDALIAGKFGMDYAWSNPNARYVRGQEIAASGLHKALADGKFDEPQTQSATSSSGGPVIETIEVSGEGSSYEALIAGKFGMDYAWSNPNVRYIRGPQAVQSGLWAALAAGKLDEPTNSSNSSTRTTSTQGTTTVSGGHQQ